MNKIMLKNNAANIKAILADKGLDNTAAWQQQLEKITGRDVEEALSDHAGSYSFEKLLVLVSPAAQNYLEQMAQIAHQLTIQRFGKTIRLYAPLYLSNYCINSCLYCGFNSQNKYQRKRLTIEQAMKEADLIAKEGFTDLLLVSSEDREFITVDYLTKLSTKLKSKFSSIAIEAYPMSQTEYKILFAAGIEGVTIYQETYNRKTYAHFHPAGPKADFDNRLNTPDYIAAAGMRQIGLGVLLGLADWRVETLALAEHGHYLMKRYWRSYLSFSFPRLRPACEVERTQFKHLLGPRELAQMIMALRLSFADAGLVLSTRESAVLRDHFIKLGITKISAGSKTSPGGYSGCDDSVKQFEIDDDRSAAEVAAMIKREGFEPLWKDWDSAFTAKD